LCNCFLVFCRVCCGLNTLCIILAIYKFYLICYRRPLPFHKVSDFLSS
jgi:hypothetical protein